MRAELIIGLVLAAVAASVLLLGPGITSYIAVEQAIQNIELSIQRSTEIAIEAPELLSIAISGELIGNGSAAVLLENSAGQRLAVFKNWERPKALSAVTGAASVIYLHQGVPVDGWLDAPSGSKIFSGRFYQACLETCYIPKQFDQSGLKLVFLLAPGVLMKIDSISYVVRAK